MGCSGSKSKGQTPTKEAKNCGSDSEEDSDDDVVDFLPPPKGWESDGKGFKAHPRGSVSAEAYGKWNQKTEFVPPVIDKDAATKKRIRAAIAKSLIFRGVDKRDQEVIVDAFSEQRFSEGDVIIEQGAEVTPDEPGLFMLEEGKAAAYINGVNGPCVNGSVKEYNEAGESFGELALLYNAPRKATVKAESDCIMWAINRDTFNATVKEAAVKKRDMHRAFLKSVEVLHDLSDFDIDKVSDAIKEQHYSEGDVIIKQGDIGMELFILEEGTCDAAKDGTVVKNYATKEYFGELALLSEAPRAASVIATSACKCLIIEKDAFDRLLGPLQDKLNDAAKKMYGTN